VVIVDSSIWIEAARRDGDLMCKVALEALLEEAEATLCAPVRLEVLGGARTQERRRMMAYFEIVPYLPLTEKHWEEAVRKMWLMRDAGFPVPFGDVLIATLSLTACCRVYARDKHFEIMRDVIGVGLYQPGYGGSYNPDSE
jgi:hypothetical protein